MVVIISNRELVAELVLIFKERGDIEVFAYYKLINGFKIYYDFQLVKEERLLNGLYETLILQELLYYIKEQENDELK